MAMNSQPISRQQPQSSQDFVRALKAPSDPPIEGGPTKIDIAQSAWANKSFYVLSKGEVITEWILTKFLREKDKETCVCKIFTRILYGRGLQNLPNRVANPIFHIRYWELLHAICEAREVKSTNHRDLKTWLTPLLHRIPLGHVVVSFFTFFSANQENQLAALASCFTSCMTILWPIAVQKMGAELLQECFGSLLLPVSVYSELRRVGLIMTASYRDSLANFSNKKKASEKRPQSSFY